MGQNKQPGMGKDQFDKDQSIQPQDGDTDTSQQGTTEGQTEQSETSQDTGFTPDSKS